jgi:hypothetical protein
LTTGERTEGSAPNGIMNYQKKKTNNNIRKTLRGNIRGHKFLQREATTEFTFAHASYPNLAHDFCSSLTFYKQCSGERTHPIPNIQTNSVAFSLQANYIDWATATCWRNLVPNFADRGVSSGQHDGSPTVVNLSFLDRSCYFSFQVVPHLSSWGWVDPVPDPLPLRKCGSSGNRTRDLWVRSQELWPVDHRGGPQQVRHYCIVWRFQCGRSTQTCVWLEDAILIF